MNKTEVLIARVTPLEREALEEVAEAQKVSMGQIVREALAEYLGNRDRETAAV
jgi:predicted HicB family RNase H-like nuclease